MGHEAGDGGGGSRVRLLARAQPPRPPCGRQLFLFLLLPLAFKVGTRHILNIEVELGLEVDLLLFLFLSLVSGLGRRPPCGPILLVVVVDRRRRLRPRGHPVNILLEAAVTTVAAAELEHDVVALVSPKVGNPLQSKIYQTRSKTLFINNFKNLFNHISNQSF